MWFWFLNCIINYNILYYKPRYILYSLEDNSLKMKTENFPLQYPAGFKSNTTLKDWRPVRAGGRGISWRLSQWVSPAEQDMRADWGRRGWMARWKELWPTETCQVLCSNGRSLQKVGGGTQQRDWAALWSCSWPSHPRHLGSQLTDATVSCYGDLAQRSTYCASTKVHPPITCLWMCPVKYTWEQSVVKEKTGLFLYLVYVPATTA